MRAVRGHLARTNSTRRGRHDDGEPQARMPAPPNFREPQTCSARLSQHTHLYTYLWR